MAKTMPQMYNLVAYDSNDGVSSDETQTASKIIRISSEESQWSWHDIPLAEFSVNPDIDDELLRLDKTQMTHRLSSSVREQYFTYLEKLLTTNYESSGKHPDELSSNQHIRKCAHILEQKALRSCMIVSLYRTAMLKLIAEIRRDTNHKRLNLVFFKCNTCNTVSTQTKGEGSHVKKANAKVQTDSIHNISNGGLLDHGKQERSMCLEQKIKKFERRLLDEEKKRKQFCDFLNRKKKEEDLNRKHMKFTLPSSPLYLPKNVTEFIPFDNAGSKILTPEPTPTTPSSTGTNKQYLPDTPVALLAPYTDPNFVLPEDDIATELQEMFGHEDENMVDIFDGDINPLGLDAIMSEIQNFKPSPPELASKIEQQPEEYVVNANRNENLITIEQKKCIDPVELAHIREEELKDSLWPCELHMRRLKLREAIYNIASKDFRMSDKLRHQYLLLFGEDSDDEFGAYSPTIELNPILIASCRKRIAPWIVQYLMRPMNDGLIGNRFLFKKLAKHIASRIIYSNPYPDKHVIQQAIDEYFCLHPKVNCIDDII